MCIIPLQDHLGYDDSCRINKPSTVGTNWRWRLRETDLTPEGRRKIKSATVLYGRSNRDQV